jgi:very-short-patch-repair endonuclease
LRTGSAQLKLIADGASGAQPTRSEAERRLLALVAQAGLPTPLSLRRVEGFEVDLLWPTHSLIVEFDGWSTHGHRHAFERDRRRDQALIAAGYRVIRVTWRQITDEPIALAVRIAQALGQTTAVSPRQRLP